MSKYTRHCKCCDAKFPFFNTDYYYLNITPLLRLEEKANRVHNEYMEKSKKKCGTCGRYVITELFCFHKCGDDEPDEQIKLPIVDIGDRVEPLDEFNFDDIIKSM